MANISFVKKTAFTKLCSLVCLFIYVFILTRFAAYIRKNRGLTGKQVFEFINY